MAPDRLFQSAWAECVMKFWAFPLGMFFPQDEEWLEEPGPLTDGSKSSSPQVVHWRRISNRLLETGVRRDSFYLLPGKQDVIFNHLAITNPLPFWDS